MLIKREWWDQCEWWDLWEWWDLCEWWGQCGWYGEISVSGEISEGGIVRSVRMVKSEWAIWIVQKFWLWCGDMKSGVLGDLHWEYEKPNVWLVTYTINDLPQQPDDGSSSIDTTLASLQWTWGVLDETWDSIHTIWDLQLKQERLTLKMSSQVISDAKLQTTVRPLHDFIYKRIWMYERDLWTSGVCMYGYYEMIRCSDLNSYMHIYSLYYAWVVGTDQGSCIVT